MRKALAVPFLVAIAIAACSSSTTSTGGGSSGSSGGDADASDTDDAADTAPPAETAVNDCKTFADRSAASDTRILTWGFAIATSTTDRCITIKKGQTVTWKGDLATYPLVAEGGDSPNPIRASGKVTFGTAGTFGWGCSTIPAMTGAVLVTE